MYVVVEFDGKEANNIAVVREEWLTPQKKEVFWPPFKLSTHFTRALTDGTSPDEESWTLYPVRRCLYSSDELLKARQKEKEAERESDIQTEGKEVQSRKRRPKRFSSSSEEDEEDSYNRYSKAPKKSFSKPCVKNNFEPISYPIFSNPVQSPSTTIPLQGPSSPITVLAPCTPNSTYTPTPTSQVSPSTTFNLTNSPSTNVVSRNGLSVVASRLAKLEVQVQSIREYLEEFLPRLASSHLNASDTGNTLTTIPPLPCQNETDVTNLEVWLNESADNQHQLVQHLGRVGGRTVEYIVKRILERLFTNNLAQLFNWTGKHGKLCLKGMIILDIIYRTVRKNSETSSSTDFEIEKPLRSWFRFSKDREGGREKRRRKPDQL